MAEVIKRDNKMDHLLMPETTIIRLMEVAVEEMIRIEVTGLRKKDSLKMHRIHSLPPFRNYFQ